MSPEKIVELRRLLADATRAHEADPLSYETLIADVALRAAATSALPELLDAAERDSRTDCARLTRERDAAIEELADARIVVADGKAEVQA